VSLLLSGGAALYPVQKQQKHYTVEPVPARIKIDGIMDEAAWREAVEIELPYEWLPGDNTPAPVSTRCRIAYSKRMLYIGFRCLDPEPSRIRARIMDRDVEEIFPQDDHVAVILDTFNDERRAFQFCVNALGVQMDAYFSEIEGVENYNWDAIWDSAAKINDSGYTVEIAIPFNQLRFPKTSGKQTWGITVQRLYPRGVRRLISSYPLDRGIDCFLCQEDKITGFENVSPGKNIEIDPTLTLNRTDKAADFPSGNMESGTVNVEPGISARWGVTPNIVLNATVNPDFSHVEADVAQLEVNTRFALRYPEKRPFFLESADFFQTPFEAVYTRTVYDPVWGVKLTGKEGRNAFGVVAVQDRGTGLLFPFNQRSLATTLDQDLFGSVLRYRRDIGKGSTLGVLYTGRAGEDYFNHVGGLDGFLRFSGTKSLTFQVLGSTTRYPGDTAAGFYQDAGAFEGTAVSAKFRHIGRSLYVGVGYEDLSPGFRADYGFIPQVDVRRFTGYFMPVIWGKPGGWFEKITIQLNGVRETDHAGNLTGQGIGLAVNYTGPLQLNIVPTLSFERELYNGLFFDTVNSMIVFDIVPFKGLRYKMYAALAKTVDYANTRPGDRFTAGAGFDLTPGKHLIMGISNVIDYMSHQGRRVYTADLFQSTLIYNFNVRTFVRLILQYNYIDRNIDQYAAPVDPKTGTFFTQFLFSYKINPRTVLFLGYSDNRLGFEGIDMTKTNRTFFLKIGYALVW
jgi:hypothetical protein